MRAFQPLKNCVSINKTYRLPVELCHGAGMSLTTIRKHPLSGYVVFVICFETSPLSVSAGGQRHTFFCYLLSYNMFYKGVEYDRSNPNDMREYMKLYMREYSSKNREKLSLYNKERYKKPEVKAKFYAYQKKYAQEHADKIQARARKRYEEHGEEIKAKRRENYKNKEEVRKYSQRKNLEYYHENKERLLQASKDKRLLKKQLTVDFG